MNLLRKLRLRRSLPLEAPKLSADQSSEGASYSPDQPIQTKEQDRFNRWPFAERIAQTIANHPDPSSIVIGLFGAWGEGKSSVLAMMEHGLSSHVHVVCVRFNPWYFKSDDQLLRSFFASLASALGKSLPTKREEIGKAMDRYSAILTITSLIPAAPNPAAAVQGFGKMIAGGETELETLRLRIEGFLAVARKRVVVFIDDIDRLDRNEIRTVFKLVKLSANFKNCTYVLAFDDKMVAEALGASFGSGDEAAGRSFLEKIIQVPLHLPPAGNEELRKMAFEGVDQTLKNAGIELSEEQVNRFIRYFADGIQPRMETPRHARLYNNAIMFALPIMKGEVNPVDQMLVEGIRIFYPRLYEEIRSNPDLFTAQQHGGGSQRFKDRATALLERALAGFGQGVSDAVRGRLIKELFPRFAGNLGNTIYGHEWDAEWEHEQRICSPNYFGRYFRYAIDGDDVPDTQLTAFLEKLATADPQEVDTLYGGFGDGASLGRLVAKLRARVETIDPAAAVRLANVIAKNASKLPRERRALLSDWSFMQAAILLVELLKRLPIGSSREEGVNSVFGEMRHLPFAFEFLSWARPRKDGSEEPLVPKSVQDVLEVALAERVRAAAAETALCKTFGRDALRLLFLWKRHEQRAGEVAKHLQESVTASGTTVAEFLALFLGTAWGMESGIPMKSDFEMSQYKNVTDLLDPVALLGQLRETYGAELDGATEYQPQSVEQFKRVALQFAYCHKKATEAATKPGQ